ncbi:sensor histidine kinase [Wukongibacter sp. M2B1]|uniref:sensor histidine kinase n=1 Tax=Wukongibacter sp. M2B1 TaxID=3088895 RepID=UPI003D7BA22D
MSLRRRITLTICSIIILLMVLLSGIIYTRSANILNKEAERYMLSQLDRASENIDLLIEINRLETEALSLNEKVMAFLHNRMNTNEMNSFLVNEMGERNLKGNYYKDLFILNKEGRIIATCMPEAVDLDLSTREYFIESRESKSTIVSDILVARSDGSLIVITVSPIISISEKVLGYAGIAMKAEYFSDIVKNLELGKKGFYSIIDSNNRILVHKNKDLVGKESDFKITKDILRKAEEKEKAIVEKRIFENQGIRELQIYKLMESKHWVLIAILPEAEMYEGSMRLLFYVLLAGSFGIILAILIGIFVSKKISQPIVAITKFIDKAVQGNSIIEKSIADSIKSFMEDSSDIIEEGIEDSTKDEIGNLRKALRNLKNYFISITKRFEYESKRMIEYSEELSKTIEESSFRTGKFISTLSHDLKTSITLIKGYSAGLKTGVIKDEKTKQEFLDGITNSVEDIEKITCDILDNAYEAKCSPRLHREKVEIKEFLSNLYENTKQYILNSNRRFEGTYKCDKEGSIYIDVTKIKRAWNNLINNGIKYSREESEITIDIIAENDQILFRVMDEGRGICDTEIDKIFDMFYRGKEDNKKGYGLGLFIAKSIVEAHESKLHVSSKKGEGTVFWFYLDI